MCEFKAFTISCIYKTPFISQPALRHFLWETLRRNYGWRDADVKVVKAGE